MKQWIEVQQRRAADAEVDWSGPGAAYANALRTLRQAYSLPLESMRTLCEHFVAEGKAGLSGAESSMRMLPTFVTKRVTGNETGDYFWVHHLFNKLLKSKEAGASAAWGPPGGASDMATGELRGKWPACKRVRLPMANSWVAKCSIGQCASRCNKMVRDNTELARSVGIDLDELYRGAPRMDKA